jgi:hypothetical protein
MNERIKELAEQAGIATYYPAGIAERLEKFAELLDKDAEKKYFSAGYIAGQSDGISETVQQCIDICANGYQGEFTVAGISQCVADLKEHFGVEE